MGIVFEISAPILIKLAFTMGITKGQLLAVDNLDRRAGTSIEAIYLTMRMLCTENRCD